MKHNRDIVDRIKAIFDESWRKVSRGFFPPCLTPEELIGDPSEPDWVWIGFMERRDVLVITSDDLLESFPDMVNFGHSVKDSLCIVNPQDEDEFLLVPNDLVEKCLAMGGLA
jgi:hypothetical protein